MVKCTITYYCLLNGDLTMACMVVSLYVALGVGGK